MYFDLEYDVMVNVKNQDPSPIGKDVPAIMTTNDDWLQLLKKLTPVDRNALTRRILFLSPTSTFESLALTTKTTGITDKLQQSS